MIDAGMAHEALVRLDIDVKGLDQMDRRYLTLIADHYEGGPVGAETIAAALSEQRDVIEDVIEPYLMQQGYIKRTSRGRVLTALSYGHLGKTMPRLDAGEDL